MLGTLINVDNSSFLSDVVTTANGTYSTFEPLIIWAVGFLVGGAVLFFLKDKLFRHH